jgi:uncharacterized protein YjcR
VKQGVKEGYFDTDYPEEMTEYLIVMYEYLQESIVFIKDPLEQKRKLLAAQQILERALKAKEGSIKLSWAYIDPVNISKT